MRREGYELAVSKPEVILRKGQHGKVLEPIEEVVITVPDEYSGTVINKLNIRKGLMTQMSAENGYSKIEYLVPTRGLLGYRRNSSMIPEERAPWSGDSTFDEYKGEILRGPTAQPLPRRKEYALYALFNIGERVQMFVEPGTHVYEGMIVGMNSRNDDMVVNPCKAKRVSNMRAAGSDDTIKLSPPRTFTLEEARVHRRRRAGRDNPTT